MGGKILFGGSPLSLNIHGGVVNLLKAPNGWGKSALLDIIAGYGDWKYSGQVLYSRTPCSPYSVAYLPQRTTSTEDVRIEPFILLVKDVMAHATPMIKARIQEAIRGHRYLGELSLGQRRILLLLMVAAAGGGIVLLDEPLRGLDDEIRIEAIRMIESLAIQRELVLVAEHNDVVIQGRSDNWESILALSGSIQQS